MSIKKIAAVVAVASAILAPLTANALPPDGTYSGSVDVKKGVSLKCTMTAVVSGGKVTAVSLSGSGLNAICNVIGFDKLPYDAADVGSNIEIYDVDVTTFSFGGCEGTLIAKYEDGKIKFNNATLPPKIAGTGSCTINGELS